MTAAELRALAGRLTDPLLLFSPALEKEAAAALSAQADLLDELEKQDPLAWLYTDKRGMKFGPYLVRQAAGSTDSETPLYARPQLPREPIDEFRKDAERFRSLKIWDGKPHAVTDTVWIEPGKLVSPEKLDPT